MTEREKIAGYKRRGRYIGLPLILKEKVIFFSLLFKRLKGGGVGI